MSAIVNQTQTDIDGISTVGKPSEIISYESGWSQNPSTAAIQGRLTYGNFMYTYSEPIIKPSIVTSEDHHSRINPVDIQERIDTGSDIQNPKHIIEGFRNNSVPFRGSEMVPGEMTEYISTEQFTTEGKVVVIIVMILVAVIAVGGICYGIFKHRTSNFTSNKSNNA